MVPGAPGVHDASMAKSRRRRNERRNRGRGPSETSLLTVAIASSGQGLDLNAEVERVKAAVLYADRVQLVSPVTAMAVGHHSMVEASDDELSQFIATVEDRPISSFGTNVCQRPPPAVDSEPCSWLSTPAHLEAEIMAAARESEEYKKLDRLTRELQSELSKLSEWQVSQLHESGGAELLFGLSSGVIGLASNDLRANTPADLVMSTYIETIKMLLGDHKAHLMFDHFTATWIQSLIAQDGFSPHPLAMKHSASASLSGGLIQRLPAFTSAPLQEVLDLRSDLKIPLARYRRSIS